MEQSDEAKASTEERNLPTAYDTTTYKEGGSYINNWPVTEHCSDAESRAAEEKQEEEKLGGQERWFQEQQSISSLRLKMTK